MTHTHYTPNDSIILEDLYGGTVGLFGETTMIPHIYNIYSCLKSYSSVLWLECHA